jgi:hypothetical protein
MNPVTAANVKDTIKWTLYITYSALHIGLFFGLGPPPPEVHAWGSIAIYELNKHKILIK